MRQRPTGPDGSHAQADGATTDPPRPPRPPGYRRVAFAREVTVKVVRPADGTVTPHRTEAHWEKAARKKAQRALPARGDLTARELAGLGGSDGLHSCARSGSRPRGLSDAQIVKMDWPELSFGPAREALVAPEMLDTLRLQLARGGFTSLEDAPQELQDVMYEECMYHEGRRGLLRSWGGPRPL